MYRLSYRQLSKLQNDAITCFNGMVRNLTTLCSHSFEIPDKICKLQASTLVSSKYKVQTSLRVSTRTCSNTKECALHRTCQGAGNSGTNWNFHSVPIMFVIDKVCEGFKMNSPNKKTKSTKYQSIC